MQEGILIYSRTLMVCHFFITGLHCITNTEFNTVAASEVPVTIGLLIHQRPLQESSCLAKFPWALEWEKKGRDPRHIRSPLGWRQERINNRGVTARPQQTLDVLAVAELKDKVEVLGHFGKLRTHKEGGDLWSKFVYSFPLSPFLCL